MTEYTLELKQEPYIVGHHYAVVAEKTWALCGEDLETAEDVEGYDIILVDYEMWSDGDKVIAHKQHITFTEDESKIKYLKDIVKTSSYFAIAYALGIEHYEAYKLFDEE